MNNKELASCCVRLYGGMQKEGEIERLLDLFDAKNFAPKVVLEIGTAHGATFWLWHQLKSTEVVISVDLPGGPFGGGPSENDKKIIEGWLLDHKDKSSYMAAMDSHDPRTLAEVKETLGDRKVDLLFIDGGHTYMDVKQDFEMYSPLVANGGFVLFHDITDHSKSNPACKVDIYWNEIKTKLYPMGEIYEVRLPTDPDWAGLGLLRV